MLEYFGFYAPAPQGPEAETETQAAAAAEEAELDEPERMRAVARGARLADRSRHTPSAGPTGPAWEKGPARER